jgi:hypothetical protein
MSIALRHAIGRSKASVAAAARWCGKDRRTLDRWLSGKQAVNLETLMRTPQLWGPFIRCLVVIERKSRRI